MHPVTAALLRMMCTTHNNQVEIEMYTEVVAYVTRALSSPITNQLRVQIQVEFVSLVWLAGDSSQAAEVLGEAVRCELETHIDFYRIFSHIYCFSNCCDFNVIGSYLIALMEQRYTFPPGSTQ